MPGTLGFPQLDPGFVGGSRPPEPEEETPPIDPQTTESPHEFVDPPATVSRPIRPPTISIAERIRLRNQERARQEAAAAQRRRQTIAGLPPDIDKEPRAHEFDPRKIVEILTRPVDEHAYGQVQTLKILAGRSPDDETQEIAKALARILQTIDPQALFDAEPWYTTRVGSSHA